MELNAKWCCVRQGRKKLFHVRREWSCKVQGDTGDRVWKGQFPGMKALAV